MNGREGDNQMTLQERNLQYMAGQPGDAEICYAGAVGVYGPHHVDLLNQSCARGSQHDDRTLNGQETTS